MASKLLLFVAALCCGWAALAQGPSSPGSAAQPSAVIALPSGSRLIGLVAAELDPWPGIDLVLLTAEPWPKDSRAVPPTMHVPESGPFAVLRVYSGRNSGRFSLASGNALPLYLETETRAYREGGQILLETKWPIGMRTPERLLLSGSDLIVAGIGWPLDRTRSFAAGGENPVIGFSASLSGEAWDRFHLLNHEQFRLNRDVRQLLLSQGDPLYALARCGRDSPVLLVLQGEMSAVGDVQAYALLVYHQTQDGLVEVQRLGVGERGVAPSVLATGDLNADGCEDIVVGFKGPLADRIAVFTNCGDGTFRPVPGLVRVAERDVRGILIGDFNGSGRADLIVLGPGQALLLTGDGRGGFAKGARFDFGLAQEGGEQRAAVGYLNDDNRLDIALAQGSRVWVLLGEPGGGFRSRVELEMRTVTGSAAFSATHILAVELDGRRGTDLVVGSAETGEVTVLLNDGSGGYVAVRHPQLGQGPGIAASVDINKDGTDDIVMVYPATRELVIEMGQTGGGPAFDGPLIGFSVVPATAPSRVSIPLPGIVSPTDVAVGHFDGNDSVDAVVSCGVMDRVLIIYDLQQQLAADHLRSPPRTEAVPVGRRPSQLAIMERAGQLPVIVVLCTDSSNLYLLRYDPTSKRVRVLSSGGIALDSCVSCPTSLVGAGLDLDGDAIPDVVIGYSGLGKVAWLSGRSDFRTPYSLSTALGSPFLIGATDINRDGVADLVVAEVEIGQWQVRIMRGAREAVCCGPETVEYKVVHVATIPLQSQPVAMVVRDLDGDLKADIAVALSTEPWVRIWKGSGDGMFAETAELRWQNLAGEKVSARPLTGFVVASARVDGTVRVRLTGFSEQVDERVVIALGSSGEPPEAPRPPAGRAADIAVGDFDGDGIADLAVLMLPEPTAGTWQVVILHPPRSSSGSWQHRAVPLTAVGALGPSVAVRAADLNADRVSDLLVLDVVNNRLLILWGPTFVNQDVLGRLDPGTSALAAGASAEGAWIVAGTTLLFRRNASDGWTRTALQLGGGFAQAAWSITARSGTPTPDLAALGYCVATNGWAMAYYDGSCLVKGDSSPREVCDLSVRTAGDRVVLAALRSYRGDSNPALVLERGKALLKLEQDPISVTIGDVNGDGEPDLIALRTSGIQTRVSIAYGRGGDTFGAPGDPFVPCGAEAKQVLLTTDLTSNGKLDIVVFNPASGCMAIVYNAGGVARTETIGGLKIVQIARRL